MALQTPAITGEASVVGISPEATWGTLATSGADPDKTFGDGNAKFAALKEETFDIQKDATPQMDDMTGSREISRIIENGNTVRGSLRGNAGSEFIGYLFRWFFGPPTTTQLASSSATDGDAVYQHVWYPELNTRANWPKPYSIESRIGTASSKLILGALIQSLGLRLPNNAPMEFTADFIGKSMQIIGSESGGTDDNGDTLPCKVTASPTLIDETPWHWSHLAAYPQIDDANEQSIIALEFTPSFPDMRGHFTAGGGANINTYALDKFQIGGRATILWEGDDLWYKIKDGDYIKLEATLDGATIQGAHKHSLAIVVYSAKISSSGVANRVGDIQYDFDWTAREDPTEGKSVQITLVNTVSSYA